MSCSETSKCHSRQPNTDNYTIINGIAGFEHDGSLLQTDPFASVVNSTTEFLPIQGDTFVNMSDSSILAALMYHPDVNYFNFAPEGVNKMGCTSQLNTSVANSWNNKNWVGENP